MAPITPPQSRFNIWLRGSPVPAFRDVVTKEPSSGRNLAALNGVRGIELGTALFACSLVASFTVACVVYSLLESPFMQLGHSTSRAAEEPGV